MRDYVKAVCEKVGVSSRGELVAKLFAEHYDPIHFAPGALELVERASSLAYGDQFELAMISKD